MLKKIILGLLCIQLSLSIDFISQGLLLVGVEQDKFGHFIAGKITTEFLEDNLQFDLPSSFLTVYFISEAKEVLDIATGSKRDPRDVEATMLGWLCERFLQWKIKF